MCWLMVLMVLKDGRRRGAVGGTKLAHEKVWKNALWVNWLCSTMTRVVLIRLAAASYQRSLLIPMEIAVRGSGRWGGIFLFSRAISERGRESRLGEHSRPKQVRRVHVFGRRVEL